MNCKQCGKGPADGVRVDAYFGPDRIYLCDPCLYADMPTQPPSADVGGWDNEAVGEDRMLNGPEGNRL